MGGYATVVVTVNGEKVNWGHSIDWRSQTTGNYTTKSTSFLEIYILLTN